MGGRVEGKRKNKSVKAKVTSKMSTQRKLSRMGKKVKAGLAGPSTDFMTRSSVIRKLQITLKDFRRLCILKGIYPRVPTKALAGKDKIYYDIKDISYMMQDSLMRKFREFKTFMKKIRRCAGRKQYSEAKRIDEFKPQMKLDSVVKERYPRFIDALRDLDDSLCMIHLFAALPSIGRITTEHTQLCSKLVAQWNNYIVQSKTLTKTFVSIKGVYFQAEIMGEQVTWLVPHSFTQHMSREVDFRVMLTFLEFYEIFMKFVLYKLYSSANLAYPPQLDNANAMPAITSTESKKSRENVAIDEQLTSQVKQILDNDDRSDDEEDNEEDEELGEALTKPLSEAFDAITAQSDAQTLEAKTFTGVEYSHHHLLFENLVFFFNREVPVSILALCIKAFGGRIGWDDSQSSKTGSNSSPYAVADTSITHHIVDRPMNDKDLLPGREYIQPQWIFDSINAKLLLPTRLYAAGAKLPPHLSPFVDDDKEGYIPSYKQEINKMRGITNGEAASSSSAADEFSSGKIISGDYDKNKSKKKMGDSDDEDDSEGDKEDEDDEEDSDNDAMDAEEEDNSSSEEESVEEEPVKPTKKNSAASSKKADNKGKKTVEVAAKPETDKKQQKGPKAIVYDTKDKKNNVSEEQELKELSMQMMTKKNKRLYDKMQYGIEKKQEANDRLESKRKLHEVSNKGKGNNSKGSNENAAKKPRKK